MPPERKEGTNTVNFKLGLPKILSDKFDAARFPLYQTATFHAEDASHNGQFNYTRSSNPTREVLQRHIARIAHAEHAFVYSCGMACETAILHLIKQGSHVIAGVDLYGGTDRILRLYQRLGRITVTFVDFENEKSFCEAVTSNTNLVLLEMPTNPRMRIYDLKQIADIAHAANPNCLVVSDNTMMTPLLCEPLKLGSDIVFESATKYLSGHHDIMAGVIYLNNAKLAEEVAFVTNALGLALAPADCQALAKGIQTLCVRLFTQQESCMKIAKFLEDKGFEVYYPGLDSNPQKDFFNTLAKGSGAVLSFRSGNTARSQAILNNLKLFSTSVSFGYVCSLASMPCLMSHAAIPQEVREARGLHEDIIRLSVGIEDVEDLINDLSEAFEASCSERPGINGSQR